MNATDSLAAHLSSITSGFNVQQLMWRDSDSANVLYDKIICFRNPTSGGYDVNISDQDVQILVGGSNTGTNLTDNRDKANEITEYLTANYRASGGEWYEVLSSTKGPFSIGNGRHYFELNIRVHFSRG